MDIVSLYLIDGGQVHLVVNTWILLGIALVIAIVFGLRWQRRGAKWEVSEAAIGVGNQRLSFKPNQEDLQIAYKIWTELSTRKLGLAIDEDHDVIVEVYNSWYEFFRIVRDLLKTIPVGKVRKHKSTRQIVDLSVDLLNKVIRPHLTSWQARFRKWWEGAVADPTNANKSPQEIQRMFPDYADLMSSMKEVNRSLLAYAEALDRMVKS